MRGNRPRDPQQCVVPAGAIAEQSASPCDSLCERPLPAGSREGEGGLGACARTSMRELDGAYGWARAHKKTCGPPGIGRQQHSTPRAAA